jgi:hypothetical protein
VQAGTRSVGDMNMNNVHLEDLPAYEESRQHARVPDPLPSPPMDNATVAGVGAGSPIVAAPEPSSPPASSSLSSPRMQQEHFEPPSDPPPGYEEVQRSSIVDELERQVRDNPWQDADGKR